MSHSEDCILLPAPYALIQNRKGYHMPNKKNTVEEFKKEINIKQLNANWRTFLVMVIAATFVFTWILCYFTTHAQIMEAAQLVNEVSKVSQ